METSWDLTPIYAGSDAVLLNDILSYERLIAKLNNWADNNFLRQADIKTMLEKYITLKNELHYYDKIEMYLNLALSVDTSNGELMKLLGKVEEIKCDEAYHETKFMIYLKTVDDIDHYISQSELLSEHRLFIKESMERAKHILSPDVEDSLARMKVNGSKLWEKQWEEIVSNLVCEIDGEKLPLASVRALAYSNDEKKRKLAYETELKAYKNVEIPISYCLNAIKGEVATVSKMRGYSSVLEQTLFESRLEERSLEAMLSAIKDNVPKLSVYFNKKAKLLGKGDKLAFYDLFAPVTKHFKKYTVEEAKNIVLESFGGFSQKLADFAKNAFESRWIDLLPKEGKSGGGFCEDIVAIKQSRILVNFEGSLNDVLTIAHELGHAYHSSLVMDKGAINSFYPMPIAETASNFCETIVLNHLLKNSNEEERLEIIENDLQNATQCILDIYSRFLFEDAVIKQRENGPLSCEEICSLMSEAQKKAYSGGLDEEYLHKYMWVCKPHYYDADFNYYNFPYAFGLIFARSLYARYEKEGKAFTLLYDKLLESTGTHTLAEVANIAGFNIELRAFWEKGIEGIIKEIGQYA